MTGNYAVTAKAIADADRCNDPICIARAALNLGLAVPTCGRIKLVGFCVSTAQLVSTRSGSTGASGELHLPVAVIVLDGTDACSERFGFATLTIELASPSIFVGQTQCVEQALQQHLRVVFRLTTVAR